VPKVFVDTSPFYALADASDRSHSRVDASSFAVMERERINTVFTFDTHFRVYRFGRDNKQYFEVVP